MTSAEPGPGWLLDPDDSNLERYWSGVAWTEYRRRPLGSVGSLDAPSVDPATRSDQSSPAAEHGEGEPARAPWVASASFVAPVAATVEPRSPQIPPVLGETATVVAGDHRVGQVGTVVDVSDAGCLLKFSDDRHGFRFFEFDDLQGTAAPAVNPAARRLPAQSGDGIPASGSSGWLRPRYLGIGVGVLALIGVIVIVSRPSAPQNSQAPADRTAERSSSYQAGQSLSQASLNIIDQVCRGASSCQSGGEAVTPDSVCQTTIHNHYGLNPEAFVMTDLIAGCVDGVTSRSASHVKQTP